MFYSSFPNFGNNFCFSWLVGLGLNGPLRQHFSPYRAVFSWLVGCFGLNGPLRQHFSLYRAVSQRERKKREMIDEGKNDPTTPPAPTASVVGPCPTIIQISAEVLSKFSVPGRPTNLDSSKARIGWLIVLGLTALWDSISVYIGQSPKEREKEERKDSRE